MRTIIAGSRTIDTYTAVALAVHASGWAEEISEVVSGAARGVDALGERWASEHGVPVKRFPADWGAYKKAAGPMRNEQMAAYADALIAVWDGESRGTEDMIARAEARGLKVYVHRVRTGPASIDDLFDDAPAVVMSLGPGASRTLEALDMGKCDSCGEVKTGIAHKGICAECVTHSDTLAAAARLTEHRAWLRAARTAPIPPPHVDYAPLRPAEHDAAVADALARGTTSLQQWKERPMPKVRLQTAPAAPAASPRVTCVVCQIYAPRALAGHAVCAPCVEAPESARSILMSRSARVLASALPAQAEFDAAYAALSDAERARWAAIVQARLQVARGAADDATRARLERTAAAIDRGDPKIGPALARIWRADEGLYWANVVAADEGRRVAVAGAQYDAALAAVAQQTMDLEAA